MLKVQLITVGKLKEPFYIDAVGEYAKRLQRHCTLTLTEVPERRLPDDPSKGEIARALAAEASLVREKLPKGGVLIALCIEGRTVTSEAFSSLLSSYACEGRSCVTFLIGGSFGLDETLKAEADLRLSLSPMTFPHHLARVLLLEQIYRAFQIKEGTKYHK